MFCPKCGTTNPDTNRWCNFCGNALQGETSNIPMQPPQPEYYPVQPPQPLPVPGGDRQILKDAAKGPLFLAAVILYGLGMILMLLATTSGSYVSAMMSVYADSGIDVSGLEQLFNNSLRSSQLVSIVPSLLTLTACIMIIYAARNTPENGAIPTGGLTILQVMTVVSMVLYAIIALLALVLLVIVIVSGSQLGNSIVHEVSNTLSGLTSEQVFIPKEVGTVVQIIIIAVFAGILLTMGLSIAQNAFTLRTLLCAKDICRTGTTDRKPSVFLAIILMISGASSATSLLSSLSLLVTPGTAGMLLPTFAAACSGASMFLFGLIILRLRSALQKPIVFAPSYPPYPAYPVYPQPPSQNPSQLPQWEPPYQGNDPWQGQ